MNKIKTIALFTLSILGVYTANAQTFKEPVSYKLKNGMNIIISENSLSPKAYSSFTLDNSAFTDDTVFFKPSARRVTLIQRLRANKRGM